MRVKYSVRIKRLVPNHTVLTKGHKKSKCFKLSSLLRHKIKREDILNSFIEFNWNGEKIVANFPRKDDNFYYSP